MLKTADVAVPNVHNIPLAGFCLNQYLEERSIPSWDPFLTLAKDTPGTSCLLFGVSKLKFLHRAPATAGKPV